ncbi:hypothetical protein Acr_18g0011720 [Actinidia rufa]|uniref:RNase H type-1 domain-containing protein n=1 Tax=Actinidia rufa TaxID=165716 RepID=A0A7J0G8E6_9ERIC|nr:hypothetical protein Acr_18g0011720 [Actinidia rufa]
MTNIGETSRGPKVLEPPQVNPTTGWKMLVDGVRNNMGARVGVVLKSLEGAIFEHCLRLNFPTANNEAEYEAFIAGLWSSSKLKVPKLHIFSDSKLVVNQVIGKFEARGTRMAKYLAIANDLLTKKYLAIHEMGGSRTIGPNQESGRKENVVADALSRVDEDLVDDVSTQEKHQSLFTKGVYHALTTVSSNLLDALRVEVLQNSELQAIVQGIAEGKAEHYVPRDRLLYFKNKLRVAADSTLRTIILHEFHNSPISGHAGELEQWLINWLFLANSQVHHVFHISQLKPFVGTLVSSEIAEFPANGQDSQIYNDPLVILSSRVVTTDGLIRKQVLVQWSGLPVEESSWEDVAVLQEVFSHFNLEDQVCFDEGGNVTDSIRRKMQTEVVTEKGETVEAVAETATEAKTEGVIVETIVESATEDRRIGRQPSWMKDYHV